MSFPESQKIQRSWVTSREVESKNVEIYEN